jgi:tetratricopeptide (TPR) repeat protein
LAIKLNYRKALPRIFLVIGTYYVWIEEDHAKGIQYLTDAANISHQEGDHLSYYFANFYLGWSFTWNCEFEKAVDCLDKCLEMSLAANNLIGLSYTKGVKAAVTYGFQGQIDLSFQIGKESIEISKDSGDMFIKAMAHATYGASCYYKGLFDEAERNLLKGSAYSHTVAQLGWETFSFGIMGQMYSDTGEYSKARDCFRKAIKCLEEGKMLPSWQTLFHIELAKVTELGNGQAVNTRRLANDYDDNKLEINRGRMARGIGDILLLTGDQDQPETEFWIKRAIDADFRNGMIWSLGRDYALYGELFRKRGDKSRAEQNLNKALEIFKGCGSEGWVEKTEKEMAAL